MSLTPRMGLVAAFAFAFAPLAGPPADHNDPNAINSIFSDVDVSAADLYDMFGWPSADVAGGEKVIMALTFAPVPNTGVLDTDMLYKIKVDADPRAPSAFKGETTWDGVLAYVASVKDKYLKMKASEVRIRGEDEGRKARLEFLDFPGGPLTKVVACDQVETIEVPGGAPIKVFVGGRDDAFFNDLPGFFRSINYAPQFYKVPQAMKDERELAIPKTLLELEGNKLFNFDAANPQHGATVKLDLPAGSHALTPTAYVKDKDGDFRFVYSGKDAQAGRNINAIILEIPLAYITKTPDKDRVVNCWGESWVLKASSKIDSIPDERPWLAFFAKNAWIVAGIAVALAILVFVLGRRARKGRRWIAYIAAVILLIAGGGLGFYARAVDTESDMFLLSEAERDEFMSRYKLVDTDGVPFADAALNERENDRQRGADNLRFGLSYVTRFAHLGWGFGPSVSALGLACSFDHDNSPVPVHKVYPKPPVGAVEAFPRVKKALFQELNMPDDSWNPKHLDIPLRTAFEIFVPNVNAIDMDTNGSWPFGRRPEDQVATRFLSVFLDMTAQWKGRKYHVDLLGDQALWDATPIKPKTPPNPLKNDKPFLDRFPYLAEPW